MQLNPIRENEDGSADYLVDFTADERDQLIRFGLMMLLEKAIEEGKKYEPSEADLGDTKRGESNSVYGSGEYPREPEQYDLFPETLEVSHKA